MRVAPPHDLPSKLRWITIAFVVKLAYALLRAWQTGDLAQIGGDTESYLDPIESLLGTGSYDPDFRMPGYGAVYLLLRLLFAKAMAPYALVMLQVTLDAFAVYALAVVVTRLLESERLFAPTFLLFLCSTYTSIFNNLLLTDSFVTSALILALYFATRAIDHRKPRDALMVGVLLAWSVFMKPVTAPLLLLAVIWLGSATRNLGLGRRWFVAPLLIVLPLAVVEGLWIARNYRVHGRVVPFTTSLYYPGYRDVDRSMFRFLQAWGGSLVHWDPKAEIVWFEYWLPSNYKIPREAIDAVVFPSYIFTSEFSRDSLVDIKNRLARSSDTATPAAEREAIVRSVSDDLDRYARSITRERPFVYWVQAPWRLLRQHLIHSGTYNLLSKPRSALNPPELAFKLGMSALYLWVVVLGAVGVILVPLIDRRAFPGTVVLATVPVYLLFAHIFLLRLNEYRYFVPAYPFMLALAVRTSWFALAWVRFAARRMRPGSRSTLPT